MSASLWGYAHTFVKGGERCWLSLELELHVVSHLTWVEPNSSHLQEKYAFLSTQLSLKSQHCKFINAGFSELTNLFTYYCKYKNHSAVAMTSKWPVTKLK